MKIVLLMLFIVGVIALIGVQESYALERYDICKGLDFALQANPDEIAIVSITITSSEIIYYDPPLLTNPSPTLYTKTVGYDMDKLIYGNEDFALQTDLFSIAYSQEVGDKFVIMNFFTDAWINTPENSCVEDGGGGVRFLPFSVIDYIDLNVYLKNNPCDTDKKYLIKNSNDKKVCVTPETRDKLTQRGYGYFIEPLTYRNWTLQSYCTSNTCNAEPEQYQN